MSLVELHILHLKIKKSCQERTPDNFLFFKQNRWIGKCRIP